MVVSENGPAGSLKASSSSGEVILELLEGAEVAVDSLGQLTGRLAATVRGKVLPEDGVVGVTTKVEGKVLGECANLVGVCPFFAGLL